MKKYMFILFLSLFVFGCISKPQDKIVLVRINDYEISQNEFEEAFGDSKYGLIDTADSRREFLENLINQKLILQEAQKKGLDKEKNFLKAVERFWEQSLLKESLDKKIKEVSSNIRIGDKEIQEAYQKMPQEDKSGKSYDQMYNQIKWGLLNAKESQEISKWIAELHSRAKIQINSDLLKKDK